MLMVNLALAFLLAPQITLTVATIHRLAELLEQAEKDCEEDAAEYL